MEKIIMFGASRGGINFLKNNLHNYEILAVADNDRSKYGQCIEGIEVINPQEIMKYEFDKVIITSMYFKAISKQLLELGVTEGKIDYASKNSMKVVQFPFSQAETLEKAERLIGLIGELLQSERYYFTFGTCLAIVRDGTLIPWDDDIDIAIYHQDAHKFKDIILSHAHRFDAIIENRIYLRQYSDNQPTSISIDCMSGKEVLFNINLDCIYEIGEFGKTELDRIPIKYFKEPSGYQFKQYEIKLPTDFEGYLTHVYRDWRVVRKHTSFYNNTTTYVEPTLSAKAILIHETNKLE